MIERATEFGVSAAVPLQSGSDRTDMTAGDILREAREAQGVHIEMLAAALKVPVQKVAALESNDIKALPDAVFARALAASVCRALHIDSAPVLAKLPGAKRVGLADADQTISTHLRSGAPRAGGDSVGRPSRIVVVMVLLLLVGAAALFWLPTSSFEQLGAAARRLSTGNEVAQPLPASDSPAAMAPGTVVESVSATPPAAPAPLPAAPEPVVVVEPPPVKDLLVFVAKADSWITVTEPGGNQILRRTVVAGETVALNGKLPLAIVVGRASGVEVRVRGEAFDLAPATRAGGVARFEVKS